MGTAKVTLQNGEMVELMHIRNPHAKFEWNGDWSDGSHKWDQVVEEDRKKYHILNENDGSFWMSYDDWLEEFETLDICYLPDERLVHNSHQSRKRYGLAPYRNGNGTGLSGH